MILHRYTYAIKINTHFAHAPWQPQIVEGAQPPRTSLRLRFTKLTFCFVISVVKIQYLSPGNPGALIDLHHTVPDGPEADAPPDRPEADKPPSTSKGTNPKQTNPQATPERTNRKRTTAQTAPNSTPLSSQKLSVAPLESSWRDAHNSEKIKIWCSTTTHPSISIIV